MPASRAAERVRRERPLAPLLRGHRPGLAVVARGAEDPPRNEVRVLAVTLIPSSPALQTKTHHIRQRRRDETQERPHLRLVEEVASRERGGRKEQRDGEPDS